MAIPRLDAPCAKETSQMEGVVLGAHKKTEEAWSFVRRAALIRENLLGSSPEPAVTEVKPLPPSGALAALSDSLRGMHTAFDALGAEMEQIEKSLGL
jgi:hypothetical protein